MVNLQMYRIFDSDMDLSYEDLQHVPIEEIKRFTNVSIVDLSHNNITDIPMEFVHCIIDHVVHLDLSNNNIDCLPPNFGQLKNLRHLDISCNQIRHIPVSFSRMKNLEWLNVKDNPLIPIMKKVVEGGWAFDNYFCCAKKVVAFMQCVDEYESCTENDSNNNIAQPNTKLEVLFSRTNSDIQTQLPITDESNSGGIVVDHDGQQYYVLIGNNENSLRCPTANNLDRPLNVWKSLAERGLRGMVCLLLFMVFMTLFISMSIWPRDLDTLILQFGYPTHSAWLKLRMSHAAMQSEVKKLISLYPIAPPYVPSFWDWLSESVSGIFYLMCWNYHFESN